MGATKEIIKESLNNLQRYMVGEAEKAGLSSEEDVDEWITKSRRAENTAANKVKILDNLAGIIPEDISEKKEKDERLSRQ